MYLSGRVRVITGSLVPPPVAFANPVPTPPNPQIAFLRLFASRYSSKACTLGSNSWRSLSKFNPISDSDVLACIEKDAKQLRALCLDEKESFLVFTFESFERSSDMVIWTRLLENLARIGIIGPRLFQVNEESDYQIYLALDKCVKIAPIAKLFEEYLHFYGSGLVRVLSPGNHFVLPLQAGFRWMNESVQPVVARREMSTDVAMNFFITEVTKTLIDTDALISVLDAALEATGVREIARAFDVTQEMPKGDAQAPEVTMETSEVVIDAPDADAPQSNVVAFRFRKAPAVEAQPEIAEGAIESLKAELDVAEASVEAEEFAGKPEVGEEATDFAPPTPELIFDPQVRTEPEELTPTLELEPVQDDEVAAEPTEIVSNEATIIEPPMDPDDAESIDPMADLANELESVADLDPDAAEALELEAIQSPDESVFLLSYLPPSGIDGDNSEDSQEKKSCDAEESGELEIVQQETILFDESADYILPTDAAQTLSRLFNLDPLGETPRYRLESVKDADDTKYVPDDAHLEVFAVEEALEAVAEVVEAVPAALETVPEVVSESEPEPVIQLEVDIDVDIPVEVVEVIEITEAPADVDGLEEVFEEQQVIRYVQLQLPFAEGLIEPLVFEETPFRPRAKKQKRSAS